MKKQDLEFLALLSPGRFGVAMSWYCNVLEEWSYLISCHRKGWWLFIFTCAIISAGKAQPSATATPLGAFYITWALTQGTPVGGRLKISKDYSDTTYTLCPWGSDCCIAGAPWSCVIWELSLLLDEFWEVYRMTSEKDELVFFVNGKKVGETPLSLHMAFGCVSDQGLSPHISSSLQSPGDVATGCALCRSSYTASNICWRKLLLV